MRPRSADEWARAIDTWGLKVYCVKCGVEGRFKPNRFGHRHRLREVRCDNTLSTGDQCGGRFRKRDHRNDPERANRRNWPTAEVPWYSAVGGFKQETV